LGPSTLNLFLSAAKLQQKNQALVELLQKNVELFAEMVHFQALKAGFVGMPPPALPRGLFRLESFESLRGERLLKDALREGEGC
jgi:Rho guanine nucleotide exchange factor 2